MNTMQTLRGKEEKRELRNMFEDFSESQKTVRVESRKKVSALLKNKKTDDVVSAIDETVVIASQSVDNYKIEANVQDVRDNTNTVIQKEVYSSFLDNVLDKITMQEIEKEYKPKYGENWKEVWDDEQKRAHEMWESKENLRKAKAHLRKTKRNHKKFLQWVEEKKIERQEEIENEERLELEKIGN